MSTMKGYLAQLSQARQKRNRLIALLLCLSILISGLVAWQLRSTGVTLSHESYCGQEEHKHSESCYSQALICGLEESSGETQLTCIETEHQHKEDCYEETKTLICEDPNHTHEESCYETVKQCVCSLNEHLHTEDCYSAPEQSAHTHTEACYENKLVCEKEEHTHTEECYQAPEPQEPANLALSAADQEIIDTINRELNLSAYPIGSGETADLSIGGNRFNNLFYYGNVARDNRVPFSDAESYAQYLVQTYRQGGKTAVQEVWEKHLYDLYDPALDLGVMSDTTHSDIHYPYATYGDGSFNWPKHKGDGPFHSNSKPVIDDLNYDFLEKGVDYSNMIDGLDKSVSAVAAGDRNTQRLYDVNLTTDVQAKVKGPVVMVLQIQTSWQMFDLDHANKLKDKNVVDGTKVGASAKNDHLANLYDIKQALLRFVKYMDKEYPGNNLALAITDVEHSGTYTMFSGTDGNGQELYVTNNPGVLQEGILGWDTFGNCEHVHYGSTELENACKNLSSNLEGWTDIMGSVHLEYENIRKIGVMIGGPTENSSGSDGYGVELPWDVFQTSKLNSVYGVCVNDGTPLNDDGIVSWIDNDFNNQGTAFKDGEGHRFTDKYVAVNEDAIFNTLVDIAERESSLGGIEVDGDGTYIENLTVSDTVEREFKLNKDEDITVQILNKDGSVDSEQTISLENAEVETLQDGTVVTTADDGRLVIRENKDGTTEITYNYGNVHNTHKAVLKFQIQAREDYIGSNNVYSNVGQPDVSYEHTKLDSSGNSTGTDKYQVTGMDTPQVNVPIRFDAVDGEQTTIFVGDRVDLKDLSEEIAKNAEDLVDNYPQINGTLSYTWVFPDGTKSPAGSVAVEGGKPASGFPDRSYPFEGESPGEYPVSLEITFTPEDTDPSNPNFEDDGKTGTPVSERTEDGKVLVTVLEKGGKRDLIVKKEWKGTAPPEDSITFQLLKNGEPVTDESGKPKLYTLSEGNGWEIKITGLPTSQTGSDGQAELIEYTVKETPVPEGWLDSYRSEIQTDTEYGTEVVLTLTPREEIGDKTEILVIYTYDSEEYLYVLDDHEKLHVGTSYTYNLEELPLGEDGNAMDCIVTDVLVGGNPQDVEVQNSFVSTDGSNVILNLTFKKNINADKIMCLTYQYGGESHFLHFGTNEHEDFKGNKNYEIPLYGLPLDENGDPLDFTNLVVTVSDKVKNDDIDVEISVTKIETGSVSTPKLVITNTPEVVLPETGGGALWFTIGGTALMAGSLLYRCRTRCRRERGE